MSVITHSVQFDNICRTCLSQEPNMKSIFNTDCILGETLQLCEMLMACSSVQVAEDDGLPGQICLSCIDYIARSFSFKKLSEHSDHTLREVLRKSTINAVDVKPSIDAGSCSEETVSNIDRDMLDIKIEFEEGESHCNDPIAGTEFIDCDKNEIKKIESTDNLEPKTTATAVQDDRTSNQSKFETNKLIMQTKNSICLMPDHIEQPNYPCLQCTASFTVENDLKIHSDTHKNQECTKESANPKSLRNETKVHEHLICSECGKGFANRTSLHYHKKTHTDVQSLTCTVCAQKLCDSRSLFMHMKTHAGVKDHVCSYCGKRFTLLSYLKIHERMHTGEKPYVCTVCNKAFADPSHFTKHVRTHSGEKPYVCALCGKGCVSSTNLRRHMQMHTGEKPYQCHLCPKTFPRREKLQIHIKQHTGERNHICVHCEKGFYDASTLKAHLRIHTGERPHTCKICNKSFAQSGTLSTHLKTH